MGYSEENWKELLEYLGFREGENAQFGGMVVYDDQDIPKWTYDRDDEGYKQNLYAFLSGAAYMKLHMELNRSNG